MVKRVERYVTPQVISHLREARLLLLSEEELERAQAQRRLLAIGLDEDVVMADERYKEISVAMETWHTSTLAVIRALKTAGT